MKLRLMLIALMLGGGLVAIATSYWPEDPQVEFEWARDAISEGAPAPQIERVISRLRTETGYQRHAAFLQAALYARSGNFVEALEEIRKTPPEGDLRRPVLLLTGECFYQLGQFTSAEQCFRTVASDAPDFVDAHRWLGSVYYDLGAMEQAIQELNIVTQLEPDDYRPYRLLGLVYSDVEKFQAAIDQYRLALERKPPSAVRTAVTEELCMALVRERRYDDVLALIGHARTTPTLVAVAAESLWSLGKKDQAQRVLSESRFGGGHRDISMIESRMRAESGEHQQAADLMLAVLQRDQHDFQARYQLAQAYRAIGDLDGFKKELKRVQATKDLRQQLTELNTQAILRPRDPVVRDELASTCRKLGKIKLAEMWQRAARSCRDLP